MANSDATVSALAHDYDTTVPAVAHIATTPYEFFTLTGANTLGGGVLLFSLLVGLLIEQRKVWAGQQPSWSTPIIRLIIYTGLLASYAILAQALMQGVLSLGALDVGNVGTSAQNVFAARAAAFAEIQQKFQGDNALANVIGTGLSTFMEAFLNVLTSMSFVFAAAIVFVLKIIQGIMFKVLYIAGPVMIGVASIPHPSTSKYLEGWIVAIVEVGLWGFIGRIFLATMATGWNVDPSKFTGNTPDATMNFFELMVFNIVYAGAFMCIPVMSTIIVRGASGASVGSSALGAATGAAAAAGRAASRIGQGGGGGGGASAGAADGGGGSSASTSRAGDSGGGAGADAPLGAGSSRSGDASAERRAAFARDGAIRKQERDRGDE